MGRKKAEPGSSSTASKKQAEAPNRGVPDHVEDFTPAERFQWHIGDRCCWANVFDRDCLRVSESSGEKLIDRFCSVCRTNGVRVAVKRVRALRPQQYERFVNSRKHGFWTSGNGATPRFRVVNNTKECMGVWLVLFEDEPVGISINWAPMPPNWLEGTEHIRLWLSKSTMVPYQPRKLKRNSASRGSPYTPVLLPPPLCAINSPPAVSSSLFGTERGWPLEEFSLLVEYHRLVAGSDGHIN